MSQKTTIAFSKVDMDDKETVGDVGKNKNRKGIYCFGDVRCFVAIISSTIWLHATMAIYGTTILTTLEKRYSLSSSQLGFLVSIGQIGTLLTVIPVTYIGGRPSSHRPRWMGVGVLLIAMGVFVASLPHFVLGPYTYEETDGSENTTTGIHTCLTNQTAATMVDTEVGCEQTVKDATRDSKLAYGLIASGLLLSGAGYSPFMTLGTTFVDDHTTHEMSAFYIGIINMMWGVGPIMATLLAAGCLQFYIDFNRMGELGANLTPSDDEWLGAWWLGLLGGSIFGFLLAIPYVFIPRRLRKHKYKLRSAEDECGSNKGVHKLGLKGFLMSCWRLMTNYHFMIVLISYSFDLGSVFGVISFIPKYIELQFGLQTSMANILTGILILVPYAIGMILGGYIVRRLKLQIFGMLKMVMLVFGVTILLMVALYPMTCASYGVVGIGENKIDKSQPCNEDCSCSIDVYSPVCGSDDNTYASACHAGCTVYSGNDTYTDCACIQFPKSGANLTTAVDGVCKKAGLCPSFYPFAVLLFTISIFQSLREVPCMMLAMRSVPAEDKTFALGFRFLIVRLLGPIPLPVVYGKVIDLACTLWRSLCEGAILGECLVYDLDAFRRNFIILFSCIKLISFLLMTLTYVLLKRRGIKNDVNSNAPDRVKTNDTES